jgi:trigger factor
MLPEFEAATVGLKVGESKTFPLVPRGLPRQGRGRQNRLVHHHPEKLEWAHLPEVDAEFAKSLGVADGDVAKMREDIKVNLEREVAGRVKARNKEAVMEALVKTATWTCQRLIAQDTERLAEMTRQDMAQRGMNVKDVPFPPELFAEKAERRVRLGLILSQLVGENNLQAQPEQVKAQIEDFAQSYEDPREVLKYYYSDRRRLAEVEALVLEENVVNYVLGLSKTRPRPSPLTN